MESSDHSDVRLPAGTLEIKPAAFSDIRHALDAGMKDFLRHPVLSAFFGAVYTIFGLIFLMGLLIYDEIWMMVPAGIGFPLVAPFLAAGLYEMSRRYEREEDFTWRDIFLVVFSQQRREFGWMAFVVLFVFWVWIYQIRLLLALFLQWQSFSTLDRFTTIVTTTTEGMLFVGVGTIVGAILATALFSITVIAMPLLLDREVDFVTAMITSVRSVLASPRIMLAWGIIIAALVFVALVPALLGLVLVLPLLGHATWHLYRRIIRDRPAA